MALKLIVEMIDDGRDVGRAMLDTATRSKLKVKAGDVVEVAGTRLAGPGSSPTRKTETA